MNIKKTFVLLISVLLVSIAFAFLIRFWASVNTTPQAKIFHIGIIARGAAYQPAIDGYKQEMVRLGYIDGQNVVYDIHFVNTKQEAATVADTMISNHVDLIHTYSTVVTVAVYGETAKSEPRIPIVFGSMGDPVATGIIKDMSHPGTNITGVSSRSSELTAKRLELLTEVARGLTRVAVPRTTVIANDVASINSMEIAQKTAKELGITLIEFSIKDATDIPTQVKKITAANFQGVLIPSDSLIWANIDAYIKQAIAQKLPLATFDLDQVKKGALVGFGPDYRISGQQSAQIINKILHGKNPGDLPIEGPDRFLTVVNLDTAQAIGLTLSDQFLRKADVIIKDGKVISE